MLIVLPVFAFVAMFLHFRRSSRLLNYPGSETAGAFLAAAIAWGALLVLFTEGLSLFRRIDAVQLAVLWATALSFTLWLGHRSGTLTNGWKLLGPLIRSLSRFERILIVAIVAAVGALLVVALVSPPNNVDSLIYHMPRVGHWAQNMSLEHYPTLQTGQLNKPNWTEMAILNLRVLWGSDRPANLVQWFSMVGSIVGVAGIASLLGANRSGRMLALTFSLSIPIGILQATSTKNDYVAAFWALALIYIVVLGKRRKLVLAEYLLLGSALGLGMLTKGTFYAYAFPVLLWHFIPATFRGAFFRGTRAALVVAAVACLINLGYWSRNVDTFGGLFGSPGAPWGSLQIDSLLPSTPEDGDQDRVAGISLVSVQPENPDDDGFLSRVFWFAGRIAKNVAQNFVMPTSWLTSRLNGLMGLFPSVFDSDFANSLGNGLWNHEDTAGNLLHFALIGVALAAAAAWYLRTRSSLALEYGLVISGGYSMIALISYSTSLYGVRYQLPFFVLGAPLVGAVASMYSHRWLPSIGSVLLLLTAIPYVLMNNTRPLIGTPPRTRSNSILTVPQSQILMTMSPHIRDEYVVVSKVIRESECRSVGLDITSSNLEYAWWWLLSAPQSGIRIESLNAGPRLQRYVDQGFKPCIVICTVCADVLESSGLPLAEDFGHVKLYR